MKLSILPFAIALGSLLACGDDDKGTDKHEEGLQKCCYLGNICHEGSEGHPDIQACHQLGHSGDADMCLEKFDSCKMLCDPAGTSKLPESCEHPEDAPPHDDGDSGDEEGAHDAGDEESAHDAGA
jgi:hypothetical protein